MTARTYALSHAHLGSAQVSLRCIRHFGIERDLASRDAAAEAVYFHDRDMEALQKLSRKVRIVKCECELSDLRVFRGLKKSP
jgi:type II secretory pathway predicted ATPase ExeA